MPHQEKHQNDISDGLLGVALFPKVPKGDGICRRILNFLDKLLGYLVLQVGKVVDVLRDQVTFG
ncbi:hypothetical protein LC653_16740 [Nostoc sp. CHAB 5784]|uniref:hypothetical protein n=1 Tax=Nostoc mirabile TaxID=2907820 RepID=UPI001E37F909|nr:hypothetical protein [Nostoc mirabile]MCC5665523.1 hypothetical protein [Nostoc mirabile CHAB5784]